ncbi:TonB-dependent receptor [Arenibacter sp. ARW7G5Y1]|uniref:SusC/RagA family TonB-linked outer membrane protein n=1 Tax=Arenibacter sp. ARW7G5Y1 TaxID=2135619 RepID=UPI000D753D6A|nr:TonB-dependent receptor [Arenibacter sp. ARW7G5Y1]PXX31181.1 TonB-linked SusC/RagA family outer membrane protein [Arenibacter sp. ARW7G5Y1]
MKKRLRNAFSSFWSTKKVILSNALFIFTIISAYGQNKTVTGLVIDDIGQPIPGVSIIIKGTATGVATDFDGNYNISASPDDVLVFSSIGFESTEIQVGGKSTINITMSEDVSSLDEVVLVGYGQKSRATLTGSVSTTTGEELVRSPQPNVSNSFAGRLSGVIALNRSGEPGADGSTIRIRGISTTGDNNPLVVIDGIANRLGGLERLNPNDIENVTVLKDASAAIYGSQAANGVILITTKRGAKGAPQVSLSYNQGFVTPTKLPSLADSPTYSRILNEINYYNNPTGGMNQIYSEADIQAFENGTNPDLFPNTDWIAETIQDFSLQDSENVSVRGGGESMSYFASLGRTYQEGIYKNGINKYDQINLRTNLDMQVSKNLDLGVDINVRKENRHYPTRSAGDIFRAIYRTYPTIPAQYSNGLPTAGVENAQNPIILPTAIPGTDNQETTVVNTTLNFEYSLPFLDGLSLKGFYSEDKSLHSIKRFVVPYTVYQIDGNTNPPVFNEVIGGPNSGTPELTQRQENTSLKTANLRLNYEQKFGFHNVSAFVAFERQERNFGRFEAFRSGFLSAEIPEFDLGGGDPTQSSNNGYSQKFTRENYFGRISYDFAQKYLLELQARYDGSSRFAKDSRFGFFPSVSGGWRLSEEEWFKSESINNFKIKATYGLLGNDRIDAFQYLNTFGLRPTDFVDQNQNPLPIFIIAQLANPAITWEKAKKLDVGLDIGLFDDFDIELNYFDETREGLLTARSGSLPLVSGIVNERDVSAIIPQENIGEVKNSGFEAIMNYKRNINDFSLFANANITFNKNEVIFLDDAAGLPDYQLSKGKPLNAPVLYEALGIFKTQADLDNNVTLPGQQLGDLIYRDVDGDGEITNLDRVRSDLTNVPQIIYGFSLGGEYRNFDFNMLFQGQAKSEQYIVAESGEIGNYFSSWADNRWSPNNKNGTFPRVDTRTSSSINEGLFTNDFWLVNTSFLRIKNVEFGFNIPESTLSSIGLKSARLYISGFNLATFTKAKDVDPEGDASNGRFYPQQKIYNIGVNVNF